MYNRYIYFVYSDDVETNHVLKRHFSAKYLENLFLAFGAVSIEIFCSDLCGDTSISINHCGWTTIASQLYFIERVRFQWHSLIAYSFHDSSSKSVNIGTMELLGKLWAISCESIVYICIFCVVSNHSFSGAVCKKSPTAIWPTHNWQCQSVVFFAIFSSMHSSFST